MTDSIRRLSTPLVPVDLHWLLDGPIAYWASIADLQRMQLEVLVSLEQRFARTCRDAWDQWICRFGGGVPIGQ